MTDPAIGRPVWAGPRTNRGAGEMVANQLDVSVCEHYEIVDPELPYDHRFRLLKITLDVAVAPPPPDDEDWDSDGATRMSIPVAAADLRSLARAAALMADHADEWERRDVDASRARGEVPPPDAWLDPDTNEAVTHEPEDPTRWVKLYRKDEE